eukprot:7767971-Prorocentrum_lima.AAC.1
MFDPVRHGDLNADALARFDEDAKLALLATQYALALGELDAVNSHDKAGARLGGKPEAGQVDRRRVAADSFAR